MGLLNKKTKDLTREECCKLYCAIGTSGLPYPASHFVPNSEGRLEMEIGVIADDKHPLSFYSEMPPEHAIGILYRDMAVPSLLHVQKEAFLRRNLNSNNRLIAIFGFPGSGKDHLAKMMAHIRDPRGAEAVDCGGRYLGDLLFEQVIDFGEDFKTALNDRIKSGDLSQKSIKIFDEEFSDALTKDGDNKVISIDWSKIGVPKNNGTERDPKYETTAEAVTRSMDLIENTIAKWESIPTQTVNTVGIRKQIGSLIRCWQEGRELILNEYTKSIEGSDDSFQTVLQFLTGEIDEATVENSMKVNGRKETYSFTLRREDMKPGFFVTMTGNEDTDGISTHTLSRSAYSRIDPFTIKDPLPRDWKHRISQTLTGVPLSTLYSVFSDMAQDDPEDFGEMMMEMRLMGLNDKERTKVPPHHITMLKNWQETNAAVEKLADYYMYLSRIIDINSNLYDPDIGQNATNIDLIMPEISARYRDERAIDFRKFIKILDKALRVEPEIKTIDKKSSLRINFGTIGKKLTEPVFRPEVLASILGTRLETALLENIGLITEGRPQLQTALVNEAYERGILTMIPPNKESTDTPPPTIASLLNQDMFTYAGGIESITTLREILIKRMKKEDPALEDTSDDDLVSLDQATALCEKISHLSANDNKDPYVGQIVTLSTTDSFNKAAAIDSINSKEHKSVRPKDSQLVQTSDFLDTLRIPTLASINMRNIWRETLSTLSKEGIIPDTPEYTALVELAENTHESKIGITTIMTQNAENKAVPSHIMVDGERKKSLFVTDSIDNKTKEDIGKDCTLVSYNDDGAEEKVVSFITDTLKQSAHKGRVTELESQLLQAFLFRSGDSKKISSLSNMMTNKKTPITSPVYIINQPER